jgi:uncharacterized protein YdeI (YjbR/CyaY-like superfamily)
MSTDPRIDAYIAAQADFARPILQHLRRVVHAACPAVEESIKWSMPAFGYKNKPLAGMAAFKAHATFGFWQHTQLTGEKRSDEAMGSFGRITRLDDLPDEAMLNELIHKAMALIDEGVKPTRDRAVKAEIPVPDDLTAALADNPAAQATFAGFPPSCRREYLEWIVEAKRPETRAKRLAQAVEWMAEGKRRNWKYENC